jgi:hypothetical protein
MRPRSFAASLRECIVEEIVNPPPEQVRWDSAQPVNEGFDENA